MFSDPIASLMAVASTRRVLTQRERLVRPARPRRAIALVLHRAAHRLDPHVAAARGSHSGAESAGGSPPRPRDKEYDMSTVTQNPRRWWALALLCGAFFMVILDANIVVVALPSIEGDLGFSEHGLQWVVSAYALTFCGLLLLGGRAADLLGRRRLFMVGLVFFTLASLLCGLAWSPGALIGARAVQGIGA